MAEIGLVGGTIVVIGLSEDEDIVATAERVLEDSSGTEIDIGVVARSLVGGRTVKVPNPQFGDVGHWFRECL